MSLSRSLVSLVTYFAALAMPVQSQTRADSLAVMRVVLARFTERRAVRLDTIEPAEPFGRGRGRLHDPAWLDSLALSDRVAICHRDTCARLPSDSLGKVRFSRPTFIGLDSARVLVLSTVGSGRRGCRSWDETSYYVTVLRDSGRWMFGSSRAGDHAWYAESLCFVPSQ
jgi:hypothetical protein